MITTNAQMIHVMMNLDVNTPLLCAMIMMLALWIHVTLKLGVFLHHLSVPL
jgi:hypothetical protein